MDLGERSLKELRGAVGGNEGKLILVVNEHVESWHTSGCYGSGSGNVVSAIERLGVLSSSEIIHTKGERGFHFDEDGYKGPRTIFHTNGHAIRKRHREGWRLKEGNIEAPYNHSEVSINSGRTENLGGLLRTDMETNNDWRLIVNLGMESVIGYFRALGTAFDANDDFSCVEALRLLGIKDGIPNYFLMGYNKEVRKEKGDIIKRLMNLTAEEQRLVINTDYAQFRGDKELMDKVAFKLNAPIRELEDTRDRIKRNLERAVKLGMHKEELILDGKRPGETLNVPVYITQICKSYEIPLEK